MNDLQWLYWDRESAQNNQRQRRVLDIVRVLAISPVQLEQFLMLAPGDLTQWCKGLVANRYAAMRLVRIHRVVQRNRDFLPPRHLMSSWMERKLANGQSALDILVDPYFLEHRLERVLVIIARQTGSTPKDSRTQCKSGQVLPLLRLSPT